MHKLGLGIVAAATALSIAAFAQSNNGNGVGDFCNSVGATGAEHDVCVACVSSDFESAVCQCKLYQLEYPTDFNSEFNNLGQCIVYLHSLGVQ